MKLIIDDQYLGAFTELNNVELAIKAWNEKNSSQIIYLVECHGIQQSFVDLWPAVINEYLASDESVFLLSQSCEKLVLDLVASTQEYLERLTLGMEGLATAFYAGPSGSAWSSLSEFLEGLQYISNSLLKLNLSSFDYGMFQDMLKTMLSAMEDKDNITIADELLYEWKDWLVGAQQSLNHE